MQPRQLHLQMDLEDDSSVVTQADLALLDSSSSSSSKSDQALQVQGSNAQQPLAGDGGEDEEEPLTVGRKRNVSVAATAMNLVKSYMGSGLLGLPFAFREGGLLTTAIIMLLVGCIGTHTMYLLVRCKRVLRGQGRKVVTYTDVANHSLGWFGALLVDSLLVFTQFGFCCAYVVFVSQNLADYLDRYDINWRLVVLMVLPVFLALGNIKTMKWMAPFAALANFAMGGGLLIVTIAAMWEMSEKVNGEKSWDVDWFVGGATNVAVMFGAAVYAFEGIGVVLPSETAMSKPQHFSPVLTGVLVFAIVLYIGFGGISYLGFGRDTCGLVTRNLLHFAKGNLAWTVSANFVVGVLIYAILATYPLQLFVVTDIIEEKLYKNGRISNHLRWLKEIALRTLLVLLTAAVAVAIPNFGLLIGLIGALGSASLQFVFPGLMHFFVCKSDRWALRILDIFYVLFGLVGGLLGTAITIKEIIDSFVHNSSTSCT